MRLRRVDAPLRCRQVQRVLQTHLDGELDHATAQRVSEHLEACRECGLDARTYRRIKSALAERRRPPDPDVMARLGDFLDDLLGDD